MVLENVISRLLNTILGSYLEDISQSQIQLLLTRGNFELHNVRVRANEINKQFLSTAPVLVTRGVLGRLKVSVQWHAIRSSPLLIEIDNLRLILGAKPTTLINQHDLMQAVIDAKKAALAGLQQQLLDATSTAAADGSYGPPALALKAAAILLNSLQFTINSVHVTLDNDETLNVSEEMLKQYVKTNDDDDLSLKDSVDASESERGYFGGGDDDTKKGDDDKPEYTEAELKASQPIKPLRKEIDIDLSKQRNTSSTTATASAAPQAATYPRLGIAVRKIDFRTAESGNEKVVVLEEAFAYIDAAKSYSTNDDIINEEQRDVYQDAEAGRFTFLLYPFSTRFPVQFDRKAKEGVAVRIHATLDLIKAMIGTAQTADLQQIVKPIMECQSRITAESEELKKQFRHGTEDERKQYIDLYKRTLNATWLPALDDTDKQRLAQLENDIVLEDLQLWRTVAIAELRAELSTSSDSAAQVQTRESTQSWGSWMTQMVTGRNIAPLTSSKANTTLTDKDKEHIYQTISQQSYSTPTVSGPDDRTTDHHHSELSDSDADESTISSITKTALSTLEAAASSVLPIGQQQKGSSTAEIGSLKNFLIDVDITAQELQLDIVDDTESIEKPTPLLRFGVQQLQVYTQIYENVIDMRAGITRIAITDISPHGQQVRQRNVYEQFSHLMLVEATDKSVELKSNVVSSDELSNLTKLPIYAAVQWRAKGIAVDNETGAATSDASAAPGKAHPDLVNGDGELNDKLHTTIDVHVDNVRVIVGPAVERLFELMQLVQRQKTEAAAEEEAVDEINKQQQATPTDVSEPAIASLGIPVVTLPSLSGRSPFFPVLLRVKFSNPTIILPVDATAADTVALVVRTDISVTSRVTLINSEEDQFGRVSYYPAINTLVAITSTKVFAFEFDLEQHPDKALEPSNKTATMLSAKSVTVRQRLHPSHLLPQLTPPIPRKPHPQFPSIDTDDSHALMHMLQNHPPQNYSHSVRVEVDPVHVRLSSRFYFLGMTLAELLSPPPAVTSSHDHQHVITKPKATTPADHEHSHSTPKHSTADIPQPDHHRHSSSTSSPSAVTSEVQRFIKDLQEQATEAEDEEAEYWKSIVAGEIKPSYVHRTTTARLTPVGTGYFPESSLQIVAKDLTLDVVNDTRSGVDVPFFRLQVYDVHVLQHSLHHSRTATSMTGLRADWYNPHVCVWEPLGEPCHISVGVTQHYVIPTREQAELITVAHQLEGDQADSSALAMKIFPLVSHVALSTSKHVELTVTQAFLQAAARFGTDLDQVDRKRRDALAEGQNIHVGLRARKEITLPYRCENRTELTVKYQFGKAPHRHNQPTSTHHHPHAPPSADEQPTQVQLGDSAATLQPYRTQRFGADIDLDVAEHVLAVQLQPPSTDSSTTATNDWPVFTVSLLRTDTVRHTFECGTDGQQISVMLDVYMDEVEGVTVVRVRGTAGIVNHTKHSVKVASSDAVREGSADQRCAIIKPDTIFWLPVMQNATTKVSEVCFKPSALSHHTQGSSITASNSKSSDDKLADEPVSWSDPVALPTSWIAGNVAATQPVLRKVITCVQSGATSSPSPDSEYSNVSFTAILHGNPLTGRNKVPLDHQPCTQLRQDGSDIQQDKRAADTQATASSAGSTGDGVLYCLHPPLVIENLLATGIQFKLLQRKSHAPPSPASKPTLPAAVAEKLPPIVTEKLGAVTDKLGIGKDSEQLADATAVQTPATPTRTSSGSSSTASKDSNSSTDSPVMMAVPPSPSVSATSSSPQRTSSSGSPSSRSPHHHRASSSGSGSSSTTNPTSAISSRWQHIFSQPMERGAVYDIYNSTMQSTLAISFCISSLGCDVYTEPLPIHLPSSNDKEQTVVPGSKEVKQVALISPLTTRSSQHNGGGSEHKKLYLSVEIESITGIGALHVVLYASYWLFDLTGLNLIFSPDKKTTPVRHVNQGLKAASGSANSAMKHHKSADHCQRQGAIMFDLPAATSLSRHQLYVCAASDWSKPIRIDTVSNAPQTIEVPATTTGSADPPHLAYTINALVEAGKGRHSRTKIVTLQPAMFVVNSLPYDISVVQAGADPTSAYLIPAKQQAAYHYQDSKLASKLLMIRRASESYSLWKWSGGVDPAAPGQVIMTCRHSANAEAVWFIRVTVENVNNATYLTINEIDDPSIALASPSVPLPANMSFEAKERALEQVATYKVVNHTVKYALRFRQKRKADTAASLPEKLLSAVGAGHSATSDKKPPEWLTVLPMSRRPWAWEFIAEQESIEVEIGEFKNIANNQAISWEGVITVPFDQIGFKTHANLSSFIQPTANGGTKRLQPPLRLTVEADGPTHALYLRDYSVDDQWTIEELGLAVPLPLKTDIDLQLRMQEFTDLHSELQKAIEQLERKKAEGMKTLTDAADEAKAEEEAETSASTHSRRKSRAVERPSHLSSNESYLFVKVTALKINNQVIDQHKEEAKQYELALRLEDIPAATPVRPTLNSVALNKWYTFDAHHLPATTKVKVLVKEKASGWLSSFSGAKDLGKAEIALQKLAEHQPITVWLPIALSATAQTKSIKDTDSEKEGLTSSSPDRTEVQLKLWWVAEDVSYMGSIVEEVEQNILTHRRLLKRSQYQLQILERRGSEMLAKRQKRLQQLADTALTPAAEHMSTEWIEYHIELLSMRNVASLLHSLSPTQVHKVVAVISSRKCAELHFSVMIWDGQVSPAINNKHKIWGQPIELLLPKSIASEEEIEIELYAYPLSSHFEGNKVETDESKTDESKSTSNSYKYTAKLNDSQYLSQPCTPPLLVGHATLNLNEVETIGISAEHGTAADPTSESVAGHEVQTSAIEKQSQQQDKSASDTALQREFQLIGVPNNVDVTLTVSASRYVWSAAAERPHTTLSIYVPHIGLSVVDGKPEEILYVSLDALLVRVQQTGVKQAVQLVLNAAQIDDQLPDCIFPTIVAQTPPTPYVNDKNQKLTSETPPVLQLAVSQLLSYTHAQVFEYASVWLQPLDMKVDEVVAWRLIAMVLALSEQDHLNTYQPATRSIDELKHEGPESETSLYFRTLAIQPISMNLSFEPNPRIRSEYANLRRQYDALLYALSIGAAFTAVIESAAIRVAGQVIEHASGPPPMIVGTLVDAYKQQLMYQVLRLAGSLNIIGQPSSVIQKLGSQQAEFVYDPRTGVKPQKPQEAERQGSGFLGRAWQATFTSAGGFFNSIASGMAMLSLDESYVKRQARNRHLQPADLSSGIDQGMEAFSDAWSEGLSGGFTRGQQESPSSSQAGAMAKGVATGLASAVAKPLAGTAALTANALKGVGQLGDKSSNWIQQDDKMAQEVAKHATRHRRPQRLIVSGVVTPYIPSTRPAPAVEEMRPQPAVQRNV